MSSSQWNSDIIHLRQDIINERGPGKSTQHICMLEGSAVVELVGCCRKIPCSYVWDMNPDCKTMLSMLPQLY